MDRLGDVLRFGDTLDELGNEALDILVGDQSADLLHCAVGSLLDFGLGIPHGGRDDGNQVGHTESKLGRGALAQDLDDLEISHLFRPFLGGVERLDNVGNYGLDGVGVGSPYDGLGSSLGSDLDGAHLVANGGQCGGQEGNEVGLDSGGDGRVLGDGADGVQRTLANSGILLVAELLLQKLNGPRKCQQNFESLISGCWRTWWGRQPPRCRRSQRWRGRAQPR